MTITNEQWSIVLKTLKGALDEQLDAIAANKEEEEEEVEQ